MNMNVNRAVDSRESEIRYNEMLREIAKVTNKMVPMKFRSDVRASLTGSVDVVKTKEVRTYLAVCRIWLKLHYQGRVSLEIIQPWHMKAFKLTNRDKSQH